MPGMAEVLSCFPTATLNLGVCESAFFPFESNLGDVESNRIGKIFVVSNRTGKIQNRIESELEYKTDVNFMYADFNDNQSICKNVNNTNKLIY